MQDPAGPSKPPSQEELLEGWARDYRIPLLRFFQKRGPRSIGAEDLVQEVFIRLARRADLATIDRIEGYLFQTAANVLTDRFRHDKVRHEGEHDALENTEELQAGFTPERVLIGKQELQRVVDALYELPERTRNVFVLYHFEHVRQVEIAKRLGLGLSTVEKHMSRANKHLAETFGRSK